MDIKINPREFVERLEAIPNIQKRQGHFLFFDGRGIYILQDSSGFPTEKSKTNAYDHWRNHRGYKLASSVWIPLDDVPIVDMGLKFDGSDSANLGEYREDFIEVWDNGGGNPASSSYRCGSHVTSGRLYKRELKDLPQLSLA